MQTVAPHIVIVGGGIAGVESAVTLRSTLPHAHISLVVRTPELRIRPNLVYVAMGETGIEHAVQLSSTTLPNIAVITDEAHSVDRDHQLVTLASGTSMHYDTLVLAPGTVPRGSSGLRLRTLQDAQVVHQALLNLMRHPRPLHGVVIRDLPEDNWSPPAYEMAFLIDGWLRAQGMRDRITVTVATCDRVALETFGPHVAEEVQRQLDARGIERIMGVPPGRIEEINDDVVIDVGGFTAVRMAGEPPASGSGFFSTNHHGELAPNIYVVGDAANVPFKGGFTCSWQARRMARALGGDMTLLGERIDGIPIDEYEYQMDLYGQVLIVRMSTAGLTTLLGMPRAIHLDVVDGRPVKLRGTLVRELLVDHLHESNTIAPPVGNLQG